MQRWIFVMAMCLAVGVGFSAPIAIAQTKPKAAAGPTNATKIGSRYYRKKTTISFGSDTISGDLTRPDGEYINARRSIKLGRLIKLREHWKKRISQAINDL